MLYDFHYLDLLSSKDLTKDIERELIVRAKQGDCEASELLLRYHARFIIKVADSFCKDLNNGLEFLDFFQEGVYGFLKSIEKFDLNQGVRFLTYAGYFIYISMSNLYYGQKYSMGFPHNFVTIRNKYHKFKEQFYQDHEREPSYSEISEYLDCSMKDSILLKQYDIHPVSFDDCLLDKDVFVDIYDEGYFEDSFRDVCLKYDFYDCFDSCKLTSRQRDSIILYYGLYGKLPLSNVEIANLLGVSKQAVNQFINGALIKLKHHYGMNQMKEYLDVPDMDIVLGEIITYKVKKKKK